jgi:hypothetical protein
MTKQLLHQNPYQNSQLLSAVVKDGNNQMFPISFDVVEAETRESWEWFLQLLTEDLDGVERKKWSFISDQQKVICVHCFSFYS